MIKPIVLDFETEAIVGNPIVNPPKPVGLAVWVPGQEPTYMAWGHPSGNNCDWGQAHEYLRRVKDSGEPLLFHNAGFDLSVWESYFCNAKWWHFNRHWERFHDTMYLLFLADPYAATYSLKPSADRYLGMAATEQEALRDWLVGNVHGATADNFGAYIARAPADLVGHYAVGDVVRTGKLFDLLYARIEQAGMLDAYRRERRVFPTLFQGTRDGVRLDRDTLEWHESVYTECLGVAKQELATKLAIPVEYLEKDSLLADALESCGAVTQWVYTPTGKRSLAEDNLQIKDPVIAHYMTYIGKLEKSLSTFMRPWLAMSAKDGRLHPNWNQVRADNRSGKGNSGTRTGRLSSDSPNFQNVPTEFVDALGNPLLPPEGLHPLPMLRRYLLPEEGHVWLKRDFSSQEIRILAHFEDGGLCEAYRANPHMDPHKMAATLIQQMIGVLYSRKEVKITGFSIIYGSGATGLSVQLGTDRQNAYEIRNAYLAAMPGVKTLMDDVTQRGRHGMSVRTWGGRQYFAEPAREIKGVWREFSYKLLNYLIQGSAADQTKESIADWQADPDNRAIFLATVHDEINISSPREIAIEQMAVLRRNMEKDRIDVPMLSEGFMGENWQDLEECE